MDNLNKINDLFDKINISQNTNIINENIIDLYWFIED